MHLCNESPLHMNAEFEKVFGLGSTETVKTEAPDSRLYASLVWTALFLITVKVRIGKCSPLYRLHLMMKTVFTIQSLLKQVIT